MARCDIWIRCLLIATLAIFSPLSFVNAEPVKAYFGGLAFVGTEADAVTNFPHYNRIMPVGSDAFLDFEERLWSRLPSVRSSSLRLVTDRYEKSRFEGRGQDDDAVIVALVLNWENLSEERFDDQTKMVADLIASVLVFDYSQMKLLNTYPFGVRYIHTVDGQPSDRDRRRVFERLLLRNDGVNLADAFFNKLDSIEVKRSYGKRIRLTGVTLGEKAKKTLRQEGKGVSEDRFRLMAANFLQNAISTNHGAAILPYAMGFATRTKMPLRFDSGNFGDIDLELPRTDYALHLTVRGFKKVLGDETSTKKAWTYLSFARLKLETLGFNKVYLDNNFKWYVTKTVPRSVTNLDDWSAWQASLLALFNKVTEQIVDPDRDWLHTFGYGKDPSTKVRERLAQTRKILNDCR